MKFVGSLVVAGWLACLASWSGGALAAEPDQVQAKVDFRTLDEIYCRLDQDLSADISYLDGGDNLDILRTHLPQIEERAEAGDRVAQFELAAIHLGNLHGFGDAGKAWRWLLEAAGPDHPLTQLALGRHRLRLSYSISIWSHDTLNNAIARMGPDAVATIPLLERDMRRQALFGRFDVARSLIQIGEPGIEALIHMLDGTDRDLRVAAITGLQQGLAFAEDKSLTRFTPRITAALKDDDPQMRAAAERTLARIEEMEPYRRRRAAGLPGYPPEPHGAKTPETEAKVKRLIGELKSPDATTKKTAADTLKYLRGEACTAVPALLPLLKDPDKDVRDAAAGAVWFIGTGGVDVDTATPLIAALDDKETAVVSGAAHALAAARPGAERAIPKLITITADPHGWANYAAGDALIAMAQRGHAKEIVPGLIAALQSAKRPPVKVIETLGKIGDKAQSAIPVLEPLLKHDDFETRLHAMRAVGQIGGGPTDRAVALLRAEMKTDDYSRRNDAIRAVWYVGPPAVAALPDLLALLEDPGRAAVEAFRRAAEQGNADAQLELGLALREGLDGVPDPRAAEMWIRRAAEQGHADAQRRLAIMSRLGSGVRRDEAAAEAWSRKSIAPRVVERITRPRVTEKEFEAALEPHSVATWNVDSDDGRPRMALATIGRLLPGKRVVQHFQVLSDGNLHLWNIMAEQTMSESDSSCTALDSLDEAVGDELLRLLVDLPAGSGFVPVEQRLVFSRHDRGVWKTETYDAAALPPKVRLVLFHVGQLDDSFEPDPRTAPIVVRSEVPMLRGIAFRADGTLLMYGDEGRVRGWRDGRMVTLTDPALDNLPGSPLGFSPDGLRIVVHRRDYDENKLELYDARARRVVADLGETDIFFTPPVKAVFSDDGTVFTAPSSRGKEHVFRDAATGKVRATIKSAVTGDDAEAVLSPDGKLAAVRAADGTSQLVDTASGSVLQTFPGSVAIFTRDGSRLIVRSRAELTLFDTATRDRQTIPLKFTKRLNAPIGQVALSPDGGLLACTYDHDRIAVVDLKLRLVVGLAGPHYRRDPRKLDEERYSQIIDIEFSPDGKTLATASMDSVVKLWNTQAIRRED